MKKRLDVILVEKGLAPSREKAKALIMSGVVFADNERADKPGMSYEDSMNFEVRGKLIPYVSRGGLKLEKAIKYFGISTADKICIDVGASTGGFTDCMLQNGASKVFAVDVGYGQFDWKLRNDPRVTCFEKTNIRYMKPEDLGELCDLASIDVSFISLTKVLGPVYDLLRDNAEICCLIKPQFEAGKGLVGKKGVVKDPGVHRDVINKVMSFAEDMGLKTAGLTYSPVKGPEGNIEYLLYLLKGNAGYGIILPADTEYVVKEAHEHLDTGA